MTHAGSDSSDGSSGSGSADDSVGPPRGSPVYSLDPQAVIEAIQRPRLHPDGVAFHRGRLPPLDLPSFGKPDDNCGNFVPASEYFCPYCGAIHEHHHVCYQYDCPLHWAHAVRRRAAGSQSGAGVAPKLDALRRYLNAHRDDNQYFHHIVISLGKDRQLVADDPLKRERETVREIMDELGIQGLVGYHPKAGDNEQVDGDDRGQWKKRIGNNTDWDDVSDELEQRPHFHVIGVAPFIDLADSPTIEQETGAVIHRITQEESNVSIEDDEAMCRAVTYVLSHCGIYDTSEDQRRLAAWMKGPDVGRISPLEKNKERIQAIVYDVASETLGISPPSLKCDEELPAEDVELHPDRFLPDVDLSDRHPLHDVWESDDDGAPVAGVASTGNPVRIGAPPGPDAPTTLLSSSSASNMDLPDGSPDFNQFAGGGGSSEQAPPPGDDPDDADDGDQSRADTCDTGLVHISKAPEYLTDDEWCQRQDPEVVRNLDAAYRSYVEWMKAQGLDPVDDDPVALPEEVERNDPPPD